MAESSSNSESAPASEAEDSKDPVQTREEFRSDLKRTLRRSYLHLPRSERFKSNSPSIRMRAGR